MPEVLLWILLFLTGIIAGVSNAVAGGGTFYTFPVFLASGIPPVTANASNAVAVWPGHALAAWAYRSELKKIAAQRLPSMFIALIGGGIGAVLLIVIDNASFFKMVPWLILFATLLFAFGDSMSQKMQFLANREQSKASPFTRIFETLIAIYGGFFGAGMGIMLMAGNRLMGVEDIQLNNALKNLTGTLITTIAVIIFIFSDQVDWLYTTIAFCGAFIGGLFGGKVAQWLSKETLKKIVVTLGFIMSFSYFFKVYF